MPYVIKFVFFVVVGIDQFIYRASHKKQGLVI